MCCFKLLHLGVICYVAIDKTYMPYFTIVYNNLKRRIHTHIHIIITINTEKSFNKINTIDDILKILDMK